MTSLALFSQAAGMADQFMVYAMIAIAVLGVCGLVALAIRYFEIKVPPLFVSAFWIVLGVIVLVGAVQIIRWMIR